MVTDSMTAVNQQLRLLLTLVGISFENDIDFFALLKRTLLALLVGDDVFDSNFLVQMIRFVDFNFSLFRLIRKYGSNNFLDGTV